ncbi:peptide deformylase [Oleispirillum naphthae]|uniref:peptide deformylase n=1 Tax=Oleispirillum naphthae TaxID=2838853 RepID=UPI00308233DE
MAILPIVVAPDPVLKAKAKPVAAVDDEIRQLMDDMLETMYAAPGIGLAAPQVGVSKRVIVLDVAHKDEPPAPLCLANPQVIWASEELACYEEGCLSVPKQYAEVERPAVVKVRFLGRDGKKHEIEADGLLATCVQHEIDHLDGILFIDYLSNLKRNMILRKLRKEQRTA